MATIYEIKQDFVVLLEMMQDPECDPEALWDSLESLDFILEDKADQYARVIAQLNAATAGIKAQEERLAARRQTIEGNIKRMKENLQEAMEAAGREKIKTELFSFGIQKNPPSLVLDTEDLTQIPVEYLLPQPPKVDRKAMLADIKAGKDLSGIAHAEQGRSLRIR